MKKGTLFAGTEESGTRKQVAQKGSALQLLCRVDGAPEMRIEWLCWRKLTSSGSYSQVDCTQLLEGKIVQVFDLYCSSILWIKKGTLLIHILLSDPVFLSENVVYIM